MHYIQGEIFFRNFGNFFYVFLKLLKITKIIAMTLFTAVTFSWRFSFPLLKSGGHDDNGRKFLVINIKPIGLKTCL